MNVKPLALAALVLAALTTTTYAADMIEGRWKTEVGSTAQIAPCAQGFCIKLLDGEHKGMQIGHLQAKKPGRYEGEVTDPADGKSYSGKAAVNGNALKLTGCALVVFCKSQNWSRQ